LLCPAGAASRSGGKSALHPSIAEGGQGRPLPCCISNWIQHGDASVTTIAAKLVIERLRRSHNFGRRFPADSPAPRFRQKSRLGLKSDVCKAGRPIEFTTPKQLGALAVFSLLGCGVAA
jgi:hypothetical protein